MIIWLGACALALTLVVGVLAVVVDDDRGARRESWQSDWAAATAAAWDRQPPPPLPARALEAGDVELAQTAGRLVAVADGDGVRPLQVWVLEDDRWTGPSAPPGPPRGRATVVATAHELVVWGGVAGAAVSNEGFAFDPMAHEWRPLAHGPLPPRQGAVGLWTGSEVVVVGGHDGDGRTAAQAAAYDATADAWRLLPNADGLPGATVMAATWTGERAVLWAYDEEPVPQPRLLVLDVAAEAWGRLDPPPFAPANAASGLAADEDGNLVATTTEFRSVGAARLPAATVAATGPAPGSDAGTVPAPGPGPGTTPAGGAPSAPRDRGTDDAHDVHQARHARLDPRRRRRRPCRAAGRRLAAARPAAGARRRSLPQRPAAGRGGHRAGQPVLRRAVPAPRRGLVAAAAAAGRGDRPPGRHRGAGDRRRGVLPGPAGPGGRRRARPRRAGAAAPAVGLTGRPGTGARGQTSSRPVKSRQVRQACGSVPRPTWRRGHSAGSWASGVSAVGTP